jgi:phytoene dehydrogenase-like protein
VFISLSEADEPDRAPAGRRTATLSTHTAVEHWWRLRRLADPAAYLEERERYVQRLLYAAELAIPGLTGAVELQKAGTPVTFQNFTRRPLGMVGGFPQTSLFKMRGPGAGIENLLLVGDSIFPGQSTAGVTLGGMRVATAAQRFLSGSASSPATWPAPLQPEG